MNNKAKFAKKSRAPELTEEGSSDSPILFEGQGYTEVGSIGRGAKDDDDEFDYAFAGERREGAVHQQVFQKKPMPAHLVAHVREEPLNMVHEDEEEEEEENEDEEEQSIVIEEGSDVGALVSQTQLSNHLGRPSHADSLKEEEMCQGPPSYDHSAQGLYGDEGGSEIGERLSLERVHTSQGTQPVYRESHDSAGTHVSHILRGQRHSGEGSRGSGWSTFVASEVNSQPAGPEADAQQEEVSLMDGLFNKEAGIPSQQPSEDLPSMKLLKSLSYEEHKMGALQDAGTWKGSSNGTQPSSEKLPKLGNLLSRSSRGQGSRSSELPTIALTIPKTSGSGGLNGDAAVHDAGTAEQLLNASMLIGAGDFERHRHGAQGETLSLSKLASLEDLVTQRSIAAQLSALPSTSGPHASMRSSASGPSDKQALCNGTHQQSPQRRLHHLGASQSARDLGPRSAAASAAAAAGAAAMAALDSSGCCCEQAAKATGQSTGMRHSNSLLGISALSALARSATGRSTTLSAQPTQGSFLPPSSEARSSAAEPSLTDACAAGPGPSLDPAFSLGLSSEHTSRHSGSVHAAAAAAATAAGAGVAGASPSAAAGPAASLGALSPAALQSSSPGHLHHGGGSSAAGSPCVAQGALKHGPLGRGAAEGGAAEAGPRAETKGAVEAGPAVASAMPGTAAKTSADAGGASAQETGQPEADQDSGQQQQVEDEWEIANQQRLLEMMANGATDIQRKRASMQGLPPTTLAPTAVPLVSFHEALVHFMTMPLNDGARAAAEELLPPPPGLLARLMCVAAPGLKPLYKEQQIRLLCLARVPFSEDDPMHLRLLQSLYACFTGKVSAAAPRFGSHWGEVGFQGNDPSTDLRGCGMLGLLQLAYLHQHSPPNAARIFQLSTSGRQEFPMAIVSINITKFMLQALRRGALNATTHEVGSAVEAANTFYAGTFYTFYEKWLSGNKTMVESGYVIKELQTLSQKRPQAMVAAANKVLQ